MNASFGVEGSTVDFKTLLVAGIDQVPAVAVVSRCPDSVVMLPRMALLSQLRS